MALFWDVVDCFGMGKCAVGGGWRKAGKPEGFAVWHWEAMIEGLRRYGVGSRGCQRTAERKIAVDGVMSVLLLAMVESMWSVGESGARAYHVGGESVLSLKLVIVIIGLGLRGWI